MALRQLPYTYTITARDADAFGLPILTVEIRDGAVGLRATYQVSVGRESLEELKVRLQGLIEAQLQADAGSRAAMLDALITRDGRLP